MKGHQFIETLAVSLNVLKQTTTTGAVTRRCSVKKVFLEILPNLQENTCARVSFLIKLQTLTQVFFREFCEIFMNTFSYRTPPVAASAPTWLLLHIGNLNVFH